MIFAFFFLPFDLFKEAFCAGTVDGDADEYSLPSSIENSIRSLSVSVTYLVPKFYGRLGGDGVGIDFCSSAWVCFLGARSLPTIASRKV